MCGWARHSGVPRLNIFGRTIIASVAVGDDLNCLANPAYVFCPRSGRLFGAAAVPSGT
jgi:hypothetical protein